MNTDEIERLLSRRIKDFDGVFSIDTLPLNPRLLVCNTDPSDKPGRHWVCICIEDGRGEYFDSFGRRPNDAFERYLNRHCSYWTFNDKQLQSVISSFCGYYRAYFCLCRSRGLDMRKIVNSFTTDTAYNDALVHAFICRVIYDE